MYGGKTNYNSLVTYYRETLELDRVRGEDIMTVNPVVFEDVKTYINKVDNNKKMILSKIGHKKLLPNLNFAQVLSPTDLIENDLVRSKHNAVYDFEFKQALTDAPWKEWLSQDTYFECKEEYLEKIHNWLHDTKNNSLTGLENFEHHDLIHGTTQAFDEAYFRYKERRLRVFRGEYAYHRRVFTNHLFINTATDEYVDTIDENDWVIISVPFCGTGGLPPQHYQQVLDDALKVGVYGAEIENTVVDSNADAQKDSFEGVWYAKYSFGPISIGYSESYLENGKADTDNTSEAATATKTVRTATGIFESESIGIAFNVNENLSISYTETTDTYDAQSDKATNIVDVDMETEALQVAY